MNTTRNIFLTLLLVALFSGFGAFSVFAGGNDSCDVADPAEDCDESGGGGGGSGGPGSGPGSDVGSGSHPDLTSVPCASGSAGCMCDSTGCFMDFLNITGPSESPSGMDAGVCDPLICGVSGGGPGPAVGGVGSGPSIDVDFPPLFDHPDGEEECAASAPAGYTYAGSFACSISGQSGTGALHVCTPPNPSTTGAAAMSTTNCRIPEEDTGPEELPVEDIDLPAYDPALDLPEFTEEPEPPRSQPPFFDWYWTGWEWAPPTFGDVVTPWSPSAVLVNLTANPEAILSGNSASLTWVSQNATSCTGTGFSAGGAIENTTGVSTGPLTENRTYSISCTGIWGVGEDIATVNVSTQLAPDLKALNLSAVRVLGTLQMVIGATIQNIGTAGTQN